MRPPPSTALVLLIGLVLTSFAYSAAAQLSGLSGMSAGAPNPEVSTALNTTALRPGQSAVAAVVVDIPPGFHSQSHTPSEEYYIKFEVQPEPSESVEFLEPTYPPGHDEEYPALGKLNVYTGRVVTYLPLRVSPDAPPGPLTIGGTVTYQICDDRVCYPPESPKFSIETRIVPPGEPVSSNEPDLFKDYTPQAEPPADSSGETSDTPTESPTFTSTPGIQSEDWTVAAAFGTALLAGLLFNVMPCVLPVLPIKAMGFYEVAQHRRARTILLGVVFSLGLITVFAILALLVLVLRVVSWGELFSYGWFIWTIVLLLVLLAGSLFGWFTFQLPGAAYGFTPRHDTFTGNYLWGGLTAVLATPCTAPLLPPLMLWASTHSAWVGVPAMIMVGVGMAIPYLLLSAFPEAARKFPRTGPWSELFKQMMGFLLLAAAAYFAAGRLIHGTEFWWAVVAVVAVGCLFLLARTVQLTQKAAPVAISAIIAVVALGGVLGWTARITGLLTPGAVGADVASWQPYSQDLFDQKRSTGEAFLVKFTANWCATCQVVEGTVFRNARVWAAMKEQGVTPIKVDLTAPDSPGKPLLLSLNPAGGIPLTAIYSPRLKEPILLESMYTADTLLEALKTATEPPMAASR